MISWIVGITQNSGQQPCLTHLMYFYRLGFMNTNSHDAELAQSALVHSSANFRVALQGQAPKIKLAAYQEPCCASHEAVLIESIFCHGSWTITGVSDSTYNYDHGPGTVTRPRVDPGCLQDTGKNFQPFDLLKENPLTNSFVTLILS